MSPATRAPRLAPLAWALTRAIPGSFPLALAASPPLVPIDVARARAQHAAYVAALEAAGLEVEVLPADDALPDGCFVEDTALVARGVALVTHPGAPSRVPEIPAVRAAFTPPRRPVSSSPGCALAPW